MNAEETSRFQALLLLAVACVVRDSWMLSAIEWLYVTWLLLARGSTVQEFNFQEEV